MGRPSTTIIGERMKFPVSFTLVFLSLSWAYAIDFLLHSSRISKLLVGPTIAPCSQELGALVLSQLAVISVVPRSVLLSFPATKPGEPRCAVRQPTGEEIHPVEELQPVIH